MKKTDIFDVLVVYSSKFAKSASSITNDNLALPFPKDTKYEVYNDVYAYFLNECKKNQITAVLSTSADITGPGKCKSYWKLQNNKWTPVKSPCYSQQIFEKFAPVNKTQLHRREVLFSAPYIKPFSDSYLFQVFSDKQKTYDFLSEYSIPTVSIKDNTPESIENAITELCELTSNHPNSKDFLSMYIMKDRLGAGGTNIYKIENNFYNNIRKIMNKNKNISFVLQPFVSFDSGYKYMDLEGFTEIRFIYHGSKVVQNYIRVAQKDDFVCNNGQGGIFINKKDIPKKIVSISKKINKKINKKNELYALDFIVSNNGNVYLLEANISPGIDWHPENPKNVKMNQKMIKVIVTELANRVNNAEKVLKIPDVIEQQNPIFQPSKELLN